MQRVAADVFTFRMYAHTEVLAAFCMFDSIIHVLVSLALQVFSGQCPFSKTLKFELFSYYLLHALLCNNPSNLIHKHCHMKIHIKVNASIYDVDFQVSRTAVSSTGRVWARWKWTWSASASLPAPGCR